MSESGSRETRQRRESGAIRSWPRALKADDDYLVVEASSPVSTVNGIRHTTKIQKIWLLEVDEEVYLCSNCKRFTSDVVRSVVAHLASHAKSSAQHESIRDKAKAFALLPPKIQAQLLRRVRSSSKEDDL